MTGKRHFVWLLRLPNGTLLRMYSWLEDPPPIPRALYEAGPHELVRGEPVPALEVTEEVEP